MTPRAVATSPVTAPPSGVPSGPPSGPPPTLVDDLLDALTGAPDGLSDAGLRAALAERHPGLKTQKVNLLCRRLCAAGDVERVGTRPIRNRLRRARPAPGGEETPAPPDVVAPPCPADAVAPPEPVPTAGPSPLPVHDPDLAWSRGVNVAASVAAWLTRRGAVVRSATTSTATGPTTPHSHDLVVHLDGADVHVEVTGWPPRDPGHHRVDAAAEWFSAATTAALVRGRAHPGARVVIALPETRRYRTLAAQEAPAGAVGPVGPVTVPEVWFVDDRGAVRPLTRFTPPPPG